MTNILLIDDDEHLRAYLAIGLVKEGHTVTQARSGNEGLRLFEPKVTQMVITDIIMNDGEGIETIMAFRKQVPDIPVIAISGNYLYLESSKKLGANQIMKKPFQIPELLDCIDQVLAAVENSTEGP